MHAYKLQFHFVVAQYTRMYTYTHGWRLGAEFGGTDGKMLLGTNFLMTFLRNVFYLVINGLFPVYCLKSDIYDTFFFTKNLHFTRNFLHLYSFFNSYFPAHPITIYFSKYWGDGCMMGNTHA